MSSKHKNKYRSSFKCGCWVKRGRTPALCPNTMNPSLSLSGHSWWVIWRMENHSLLTVWPLVGSPCSNGCTQRHTHMSSTHWTQWVNRTTNKRIWMKLRQFGWLRDGWLRGWVTVYMYTILKTKETLTRE